MSAFTVSDKHINTLVTYASQHKVQAWYSNPTKSTQVAGNEQAIAELLLAENTRSVNYRYKESEPVAPITFEFETGVDAVGIIKACDCLDYQCCETDDYEATDAYALLQAIRSIAVTKLPGYDEAAWLIH